MNNVTSFEASPLRPSPSAVSCQLTVAGYQHLLRAADSHQVLLSVETEVGEDWTWLTISSTQISFYSSARTCSTAPSYESLIQQRLPCNHFYAALGAFKMTRVSFRAFHQLNPARG